MAENTNIPLFKGKVKNGETLYVPLPIHKEGGARWIAAQLAWLDATSNGTTTIELTSSEAAHAQAGSAWQWKDSGLTITGPAGAAAGSFLVNVENVRQRRARLKFVAAADSMLELWDGENPNDPGDGRVPGVTV